MISDILLERLALTLLQFAWQAALIVLVLVAVTGLVRLKSPSARYAANLLAFCVMAACPVVTFVSLESSASQARNESKEAFAPLQANAIHRPESTLEPGRKDVRDVARSSTSTPNTPPFQRLGLQELLQASKRWIVLGWMVGVALLGARLLLGWACLQRLKMSAEQVTDNILRQAERIARSLGLRMPRVGASSRIHEAIAAGLFRPIVLFPTAWLTDLPPAMLQAVLAHELAHLRRWDLWVNLFQRLTEMFLFYHPAVWWLSRQLRLERESCCDDLAVCLIGDRLGYAPTLEHVGRLAFRSSSSDLAIAMGVTQMNLLTRVKRVLDVKPAPAPGLAPLVGVLALLMSFTVCWTVVCGSGERSAAGDQTGLGRDKLLPASDDAQPKQAGQAKKTDEELLLGTWRLNSATNGGKPMPAEEVSFLRLTFSKDGKLDLGFPDLDKNPKSAFLYKIVGPGQLDFGPEKQLAGIFKFEGADRLALCFVDGAPEKRPIEFASPPGSNQSLWVLQRVKPNEELTAEEKANLEKARQKVREAASRAITSSNLRQIGTSFHHYHSLHNKLPAHAIYSKDGKTPLLSWRVSLLPHLEQDALYKQFKLDEPWDSEHNKKLIAKMPDIYAAPVEDKKREGMTYYQVFAGPDTVFNGPRSFTYNDFLEGGDGSSNTILVVEASEPVIWTKPADLELPKAKGKMPAVGGLHGDRFFTVFCDGAVHFLPRAIDPGIFRALVTPKGREDIDWDKIGK